MTAIDLNADLGESYGAWTLGDDDAMLAVVSSANVACGFHAGDPATLLRTCHSAVTGSVRIGAQVGYHDLAGFGRRFVDIEPAELTADVIYQMGALHALAQVAGSAITYVKPHGALYNAIVHHREQARAVVRAVTAYDATLPVLGLPGSIFLEEAERAGAFDAGGGFHVDITEDVALLAYARYKRGLGEVDDFESVVSGVGFEYRWGL